MRRSKNASPNLTLLAWKSCSYPRRSGARVRQAWHLPPAAGGPRPAVPLHSVVDITAAKGFTTCIQCLFDAPAVLWQPPSWDLWRVQEAERTEATIEALGLSRNPTLEGMGLSTNPVLEAFGLAPVSVSQNSGEAAVPKPAEPRSTILTPPSQELLT